MADNLPVQSSPRLFCIQKRFLDRHVTLPRQVRNADGVGDGFHDAYDIAVDGIHLGYVERVSFRNESRWRAVAILSNNETKEVSSSNTVNRYWARAAWDLMHDSRVCERYIELKDTYGLKHIVF